MSKLVLCLFSIGIFSFLAPLVNSAFAASLQFDPVTVSTTVGQTFDVKLNANLGSDTVTSVDAYVLYDPSLLDVVSVSKGTLFPTVSQSLTQSGKAYVGALVDDPATAKTGMGTLATMTFKAKANGTATLKYDCTQGSTTDTNVNKNDANSTDVVQCSSNGQSVVTIGGGGDTTKGALTATSVPTQASKLPQSGIASNIGTMGMFGTILVIVGFGVKLLL